MRLSFTVAVLSLVPVFSLAGPASAAESFATGYEAYKAGEVQMALAIWLNAAGDGDADAQWVVGNMFASGEGMARPDPAAAAAYYKLAARQSHVEAQISLATLYRLGRGVQLDSRQAVRWLYKAALAGHPVAQTDLGDVYYHGGEGGVGRDLPQAFEWYRLAARNGVAVAQFRLAQMYLGGIGTDADAKQGLIWLIVARDQAAAPTAAELYWSKRVMPLDRVVETDAERRTLRQILLDAYAARASGISAAELDDARRAAAEWDPAKY